MKDGNLFNKIKYIPIILIFLLWFVNIHYFYPGMFSPDSFESWKQFNTHEYTDWHPPIMTIAWHLFKATGAVFLFHSFLYYAGLIIIVYYALKNKYYWQPLTLLLIIGHPLVFMMIDQVWKDVGFMGSTIFSISLLLILKNQKLTKLPQIIIFLIILLCLYYALSIRHNSVFAIIPISYLFFRFIFDKISFFKNAILTIAFIFISLIVNHIVTYTIFEAKPTHPEYFIIGGGIAYIECETKHAYLIPNEYFEDKSLDKRRNLCAHVQQYFFNPTQLFIEWPIPNHPLKPIKTKEEYAKLKHEWLKTILKYPSVFIGYNFKSFWHVFTNNLWFEGQYLGKHPDVFMYLEREFHKNKIFQNLIWYLSVIIQLFFFVYFIWKRELTFSLLISFSGLFYLLGWIPIVSAEDARYFLWFYLAQIIALNTHYVKWNGAHPKS